MRALSTESSARRETNYMLVRCCALTAVLVVPMLIVGFHRPDETTGEVHTDEVLPEPAAYTRSVHHTRADHTLRYGDEERLRAKVPLLPGATYAAFVKSMPIVCVDVLLTRNSDGAALLVLRHSEPVRGLHWFPGGRLLFGETFTEAALRKVRALCRPPPCIQSSSASQHSAPQRTHTLSLSLSASHPLLEAAGAQGDRPQRHRLSRAGDVERHVRSARLWAPRGHAGCEWPSTHSRVTKRGRAVQLLLRGQRPGCCHTARANATQFHCTTRWNTLFEKSAWDAPTQTVRPHLTLSHGP